MEALLTAIKAADVEGIKNLLTVQPELAYQLIPQQGITPLMLAIYYRKAEVITAIRTFKKDLTIYEASAIGELASVKQLLAEQAVLLDTFSPDGFTCLGLACFFGHLEIVKYLIENGANVNIPSHNAFKVAPIHSACAISNEQIIVLLLENGANVNAKQQNGVTPLHSVAHHGQTHLVKLLIRYGADMHAKMDTGQTPLAMAEEKGFEEVASLLRVSESE